MLPAHQAGAEHDHRGRVGPRLRAGVAHGIREERQKGEAEVEGGEEREGGQPEQHADVRAGEHEAGHGQGHQGEAEQQRQQVADAAALLAHHGQAVGDEDTGQHEHRQRQRRQRQQGPQAALGKGRDDEVRRSDEEEPEHRHEVDAEAQPARLPSHRPPVEQRGGERQNEVAHASEYTIWGVNAPNPTAAVATARARLLEIIREKAIVHGRVTLSSGREADYYVDLRRISLDGEAAPLVGMVMRDLTRDLTYAAVGGLTLGADPVATAMLHSAASDGERLDAFVVRKAGKAHGLQQRIEGPSIAGRQVLVVEDTTTTGRLAAGCRGRRASRGRDPRGRRHHRRRATGAGPKIEAEGVEYRFVYSLDELGLA